MDEIMVKYFKVQILFKLIFSNKLYPASLFHLSIYCSKQTSAVCMVYMGSGTKLVSMNCLYCLRSVPLLYPSKGKWRLPI